MASIKIYTLSDPETDEVRYIGKTIQTLTARLKRHKLDGKNSSYHRANWIRSLQKRGLQPKIDLLELCSEEDWQWTEIYWIEQFRQWGFRLVNGTEGGDGNKLKSLPQEWKDNISKGSKGRTGYWKGKTRSESTKTKMKESHNKRYETLESRFTKTLKPSDLDTIREMLQRGDTQMTISKAIGVCQPHICKLVKKYGLGD